MIRVLPATAALCALAVASCGYPSLPRLSGGDAGNDSTTDAATSLALTASPSSFILHANDTRDTVLTVTNPTDQPAGTPMLSVSGLTLGTMIFMSSTCTGDLAPRSSCTVIGRLTATTAGEIEFDVSVAASSVMGASVSLPTRVMAACPANCGADGTANCCASSVVPGNATGAGLAGTPFLRGYDAASDLFTDMSAPATVSDVRLDSYEVSVGRFRMFVEAGFGTQQKPPAADAGARSTLPGSGWNAAAWNAILATDTAMLVTAVKCDANDQTWTDTAGANEALPMNCITWYEAMAFCIWDGGYLPTEAEWHYAASGGSEQRAYPWSSPAGSTTFDCTYANYNPGTQCVSATTGVGSASPTGDGRWGHADLAGNVWEWNLDWYDDAYPMPCDDCANLTGTASRVRRSGGFANPASNLRAAWRAFTAPVTRADNIGVRCARAP